MWLLWRLLHYEYISYYLATSCSLTYLVGQLLLLATVGQLLSTYLSSTYWDMHTYDIYLCKYVYSKNNAKCMNALKCKCEAIYVSTYTSMYIYLLVTSYTPLHHSVTFAVGKAKVNIARSQLSSTQRGSTESTTDTNIQTSALLWSKTACIYLYLSVFCVRMK